MYEHMSNNCSCFVYSAISEYSHSLQIRSSFKNLALVIHEVKDPCSINGPYGGKKTTDTLYAPYTLHPVFCILLSHTPCLTPLTMTGKMSTKSASKNSTIELPLFRNNRLQLFVTDNKLFE